MFLQKKTPTELDSAITSVYARMNTVGPDDPEYTTLVKHVKELESIKGAKPSRRPSPDTMWIVGAGLAQVLIVVMYENAHVLTSKAVGFIFKIKT